MGHNNSSTNWQARLLKGGLVLAFGFLSAASSAIGQVQGTYLNLGNLIYGGSGFTGNTVPYPPNINATNFVNKGLIEIEAAPNPYQTFYTLNFTNFGEMIGSVGWEFDYGTNSSPRSMAASFFNNSYNPSVSPIAGVIESEYTIVPNPTAGLASTLLFVADFSPLDYIWVSATNIVNRGLLLADAAGEIMLNGTNVNLSRGIVYVNPIGGTGSANGTTNFTSDIAIYDLFWGATNIPASNFSTPSLWNGVTANSISANAAAPCSTPYTFTMSFPPIAANSYSNSLNFGIVISTNINEVPPFTNVQSGDIYYATNAFPSNVIYQAAFVYATDPYISAVIGFSPSTTPNNPFQTVNMELSDSLTGNNLEVDDSIASSPAHGLLPNSIRYPAARCSDVTERPANYLVSRLLTGFSFSGDGVPAADFLYSTNWNNASTNAIYSVYSFFVDNQMSEPPTQPGDFLSPASSVTNLVGRTHIYAGNLNLFDTEIRAEGELVVQAKHVISSQNASIDCENLSYNLGATNGLLTVQNFTPPSGQVARLQGTNYAWSAFWTNLQVIVTPSYIFSNIVFSNTIVNLATNPPTTNVVFGTNMIAFYAPLTNFIHIWLSDTMVDSSPLTSFVPVSVYDLLLHSTNVVINDTMNVIQNFLVDGPSLTLNGSLTFPGVARGDPLSGTTFGGSAIQNWVYTMAPTLRYFTNNGSLSIPHDAHFGDDGPTNYLAFINNGSIVANDQTINCVNLQVNNGLNEALVSDFSATANTAVFSNAQISAGGDINISANSVLIDPSILTANYSFNFNVTNSLSDSGIGTGNVFQCTGGINLWVKPAAGDLWGSTFTITTWFDDEADSFWAGQDRGAFGAGYTNNVALNDLVLSPQNVSPPYYPLFFFSGTGVSNGLYVGTLDLSQLSTNGIGPITNMIAIDPSLTIYFAHMLLGFTPPGSQTPEEYMDGQFGGHLRWVKNFNAFTASARYVPLVPKVSASVLKPKGEVNLMVNGTPGQVYVVQASTNLVNWVPVYTNNVQTSGLFQFMDPNSSIFRSRFYRVVTGN